MAVVLVGIAGGSCSGKTTLAAAVAGALGEGTAVVIPHDAYYRDLAHLALGARARRNFDEPAALDNERLLADLVCLRAGGVIDLPSYDFTTHARRADGTPIASRPVIIVEGILILAVERLRALFDLRVFVDASAETRLRRRLSRDVLERGRSRASVMAQYNRTTAPMHEQWVVPSRCHAELIVFGEDELAHTTATVVSRLRDLPTVD